MKAFNPLSVILAALLVLAACEEEPGAASAVAPQEPGAEDVGHYCGMIVENHSGPKGHIFLSDQTEPLWFSSIRDTLAFTMLPEEPDNIAAIFVNDMGQAKNWDHPEPGTWVAAREAHYVIGSDARGGMGAPAIVPFGDLTAAKRFVEERGGSILAFDEIPQEMVLGPADEGGSETSATGGGSHERTQ